MARPAKKPPLMPTAAALTQYPWPRKVADEVALKRVIRG